MNERLKHMGRLAVLRERKAKLEIRLSGLRTAIRDNLDLFERVEDLNLELVCEQAIESRTLQIEYLETAQQIKAVEKALGI
jgi:uncharacterized protein YigA (DUF484 family)